MGRLILSRAFTALIVLWIVSIIVFTMTALIPGDPAYTILGDAATPEQVAVVRETLGLNDPIVVRYLSWLGSAVTGDLGSSLFTSLSVTEAIGNRIGPTIALILSSLVVSFVVGILLGMFAARKPGGLRDKAIMFTSSIGIAVPNFWLGLMLIAIVVALGGFLPTGGYTPLGDGFIPWLESIILPVLALAAGGVAEIARQSRASIIDTSHHDFVRTLHAKGLSRRSIEVKHVVRNAMIPVITVAGLQVSRLFGMSILIESVFRIPGLGSLLVDAVFARDIIMVQGTVLLVAAVIVVVNFFVDISYRFLDPRAA